MTIVNGAFRPQRLSGQQRYATEIANRLVHRPGFRELAPTGRWVGSPRREWAWALGVLPLRARRHPILSLTARAPATRRQVVVVHDLFPLTHPEWYTHKYIATHAPLLRFHLRHAEALVAVSEPLADEIEEMFGRTASVAPNAPSTVFFRPLTASDALFLSERGLRDNGFFLAVGSIDSRKNLRRLAAAYGRLSPAERTAHPLVIAGGSADIFRSGHVEWPAETILLGHVDDDGLRALYASALTVVFPSLAEGFGLPLVEAAASGARAIVASDIPVFRWICGDRALYIDPLSEDSILEGLRAALTGDVPDAGVSRTFAWDESADIVADACRRLQRGDGT